MKSREFVSPLSNASFTNTRDELIITLPNRVELTLYGDEVWVMMNACRRWIDNNRKERAKDA